jgi:hypothetical protein
MLLIFRWFFSLCREIAKYINSTNRGGEREREWPVVMYRFQRGREGVDSCKFIAINLSSDSGTRVRHSCQTRRSRRLFRLSNVLNTIPGTPCTEYCP